MSGRPRTTSFAEQNKQNQQQQPSVLQGMKVTSKLHLKFVLIQLKSDNRIVRISLDFVKLSKILKHLSVE